MVQACIFFFPLHIGSQQEDEQCTPNVFKRAPKKSYNAGLLMTCFFSVCAVLYVKYKLSLG